MSAGIVNWLQVNIVNNPQVLQSLIALIMLIVARYLMSEKPTKEIPFKRISGAVLLVFAMFVFLYANIADLADVFTVWAMLVLAGVAVFSFEESRHLREENRQREERDRKERRLSEIIEWAKKCYELFYDMQKSLVYEGNERAKLEKALTMLWAEKDAVSVAAKDIEADLGESVNSLKDKMDEYWRNKGGWKPDDIKKAENALENLFAELITKAAGKKAELKL